MAAGAIAGPVVVEVVAVVAATEGVAGWTGWATALVINKERNLQTTMGDVGWIGVTGSTAPAEATLVWVIFCWWKSGEGDVLTSCIARLDLKHRSGRIIVCGWVHVWLGPQIAHCDNFSIT
jgi:hypothetical protein